MGVSSLRNLAERLRLSIKVGKEYAMDRKQYLRPSGTTAALFGLNSVMALRT